VVSRGNEVLSDLLVLEEVIERSRTAQSASAAGFEATFSEFNRQIGPAVDQDQAGLQLARHADGPDLEAQGDLRAHEYKIGDGKLKVAKVLKKGFRIRDSYGLQIEPDPNDALILAVTVAIDAMVHPLQFL
jgi:hypothetical protein